MLQRVIEKSVSCRNTAKTIGWESELAMRRLERFEKSVSVSGKSPPAETNEHDAAVWLTNVEFS